MFFPSLATPVMHIFRWFFHQSRDFVYPALCIVCDAPLKAESHLCPSCINTLTGNATLRNACPLCAINTERSACSCVHAFDYPFERIISLFDYTDTVKSVMQHIKYQGNYSLAYHIGMRFSRHIARERMQDIDCIVPVPLHPLRHLKRGYNQALHFGRGLNDGFGLPLPLYPHALVRSRHTRSQTTLNREKRQANLNNAFRAHPRYKPLITNKRIALIDDVVTTGATTAACTRALLDTGARSVIVISLARD